MPPNAKTEDAEVNADDEHSTSTSSPEQSVDSLFAEKFSQVSQACHPARNFCDHIAELLNGVQDKEALYRETCESYKYTPD